VVVEADIKCVDLQKRISSAWIYKILNAITWN